MADGTTDVNEEVEEKLAAAATEESSTAEEEVETAGETTEETEERGENRIPQSRFNEVNEALKDSKASGDLLTAQLAEAQAKQVELSDQLLARNDDIETLNEIKSYINDPTMAAHIEAIDAKLKGIDVEVDTGKTTPEDALAKTKELLQTTREEIADATATQQAENLVAKADVIADKLLAQLPEQYNDEDRNVITDLWTEKMDWDAAVANPDNLAEILTADFQSVVDRYGVPRGALLSREEVEELTPEADTNQTPEQELEKVMDLDWGAVKETETKPGFRPKFEPVEAEEDFNAVLGEIIRQTHGR